MVQTFIDDQTRYVWVYFLKKKDQVFEKFLEWKTMVEKETDKNLNVLCTDNGGEFTSSKFEAYLKSEGVCYELTIPKIPEQNGVAEHMNRTLLEATTSMLSNVNLSPKLWAEALLTAAYLRKRSPTKVVRRMTPQEAWTGAKPQVDHLRVFGCQAYVKMRERSWILNLRSVFSWDTEQPPKGIVFMIHSRKGCCSIEM